MIIDTLHHRGTHQQRVYDVLRYGGAKSVPELVDLLDLPIRSVRRAIEGLGEDRVFVDHKRGRTCVYALHPLASRPEDNRGRSLKRAA